MSSHQKSIAVKLERMPIKKICPPFYVLSQDTVSDRDEMIKIGGCIYEKICRGLKNRAGVIYVAAELIGEMAHLADSLKRSVVITGLDVLACNTKESRLIVSLYTLIHFTNNMTIFRLTDSELDFLEIEMYVPLTMEVWTLKSLINESLRCLTDYYRIPN